MWLNFPENIKSHRVGKLAVALVKQGMPSLFLRETDGRADDRDHVGIAICVAGVARPAW